MQYEGYESGGIQTGSEIPVQHAKRLPKSSIRVLKQWYIANSRNPRPSEEQKRLLQEQTGLTLQQISNWFANARRRGIGKVPTSAKLCNPEGSASIPTPHGGRDTTYERMDPLERWRNSPPEQEAASLADIVDAVNGRENHANGTAEWAHVESSTHTPDLPSSEQAYSESSFGSLSSAWTGLSDSSAQSAVSELNSQSSHESFDSVGLRQRRRRRRSVSTHQRVIRSMRGKGHPRMFQCTFCTDTFKTKYDWTRHEGTLHLVLEKWTCSPGGPTHHADSEEFPRCVFCHEKDPSDSHLLSHNHDVCSSKPVAERSFGRKDHLRQHLRLIHGVNGVPPSLNTWKTSITHVKSRCGFCGEQFTLWSERNEHIGDHFREGFKMIDWKGDRGFDAGTALIVENGMPPYLIGAESNEFEPFSATKNMQKATPDTIEEEATPSRFQDLTAQLASYVNGLIQEGIVVTDESVRRQARLIMFGDDDAWNQTPADNDDWLRFFKSGLGLNTTTADCQQVNNGFEYRMISTTAPTHPSNLYMTTSYPEFQQSLTTPSTMTQSQRPDLAATYHADPFHGPTAAWPLAWQSPECLAEYRLMQQNGIVQSTLYTMNTTQGVAEPSIIMPGNHFNSLTHPLSDLETHQTPCAEGHYGCVSHPSSAVPNAIYTSDPQWSLAEDLHFPMGLEPRCELEPMNQHVIQNEWYKI